MIPLGQYARVGYDLLHRVQFSDRGSVQCFGDSAISLYWACLQGKKSPG